MNSTIMHVVQNTNALLDNVQQCSIETKIHLESARIQTRLVSQSINLLMSAKKIENYCAYIIAGGLMFDISSLS